MAQKTLPLRSDIPVENTWNAPSVFVSDEAWAAELKAVSDSLPGFQETYQGHLADGPGVLADYLEAFADLYGRTGKVYVYASMYSAMDTGDQDASAKAGQAMGLYSRLAAASAFAEPEMLAVGRETLSAWMEQEPRLAIYAHYVDNLFRKRAHVRSAEVEEVLGMVAQPFGNVYKTATTLANADLKFADATAQDGEPAQVASGSIQGLMEQADRDLRRTAWESYHDGFLSLKNTFASSLATAVKQDVFYAQVRRHTTALEASLYANNIPVEVFHNLLDTFRRNVPTWHRYWEVRQHALGVDTLHPYDIWAPLTESAPVVPYAQAVDWISAGMQPLGDDYVNTLRQGCLHDRWVDIYPNQGKRLGAFSSGWKGTYPFIMTNYVDNLFSMSALTHELGHSMHSYLTWQTQPMVYADYSLFVAEVASNFNQALVRAHLLDTNDDPRFQIAVIEEAMANFYRYFLVMPTLARFELEMHEQVERGEDLTADGLITLMADLFTEVYGDTIHIDRERVGITWATFNHLYANFYVFQYATGISAAHALAKAILDEKPGAVESYLSFLKAGGSLYPLDALKLAGVDMLSPEAVETTFATLAGYVERLVELTGA
ncbi:MAG: oligoendopeptidase F [Anaerolineae bacterium]|nr:oligoendopeptidase F [Anaerolineae bacterium]